MDIPFKQHKALIGKAGAHIKSIVQECGGDATVHFPQDGGSTVTIRGDRKDVDKVSQSGMNIANIYTRRPASTGIFFAQLQIF